MPRLTTSSLEYLPSNVVAPEYDRSSKTVSHAHIGVGNFHRAHQAVYADDLLAGGSQKGAIIGFSMRSPRVIDALAPQDLLYSVTEVTRDGLAPRVIGSLRDTVFVPADPRAAIARLADPSVEMVTITVTEAGYCWSDETRSLDMTLPNVIHDIQHPTSPRTMPGLLVAAVARRLAERRPPLVIIPCDNIVDNGTVTRTLLTQLAAEQSSSLARSISMDAVICSTMVDRMVPTITPATVDTVNRSLGAEDELPILTEPFRQWVVQDSAAVRPWEEVGVEIVTETGTHERLKLHVLNGLHSAFAYLGLRLGHAMISDAVADPRLATRIRRIVDEEIVPSVVAPPGIDPARYADSALARFAEPALGYTTTKVATDGSLKLQQRVLPTLRTCLESKRPVDGLALVIAAWGWVMFGPDRSALAVADDRLDRVLGDLPRPLGPGGFTSWAFAKHGLLGDLAGSSELRQAMGRQAARLWREPPHIEIGPD